MILTPESAALLLATHRRGEDGSVVLGNAPPTDPLMWATCACGWTGTKQGVILGSPLTERMLAALTEDWELHVARELVAGATVDTEADGITITVQIHGQTLPNRPFLVAQVRHLDPRLWRNARAADRNGLGLLPGLLQAAAIDATAEFTTLANLERRV